MAIGDGFGQLLRPVGTTPLSGGVAVVGSPIGEILQKAGQELEARVRPVMIDRAAQQGAEDGAAGTIEDRGMVTDWDVAYTRAATAAAIARADTERDETIADLATQFQDDPDGFEAAFTQARQQAVSGSPDRLAVRVEQSWQRSGIRQLNRIRARRVSQDAERARGEVQARENTLRGALEGHARNGTLGSEEAQEAMRDLNAIRAEKVANPVWGYGPVEAERDSQIMNAQLSSLTAGRAAVSVFEEAVTAGETLAGAQARSRQALLERFGTDPALAGLTEAERTRMLNAADNALGEQVTQRRQEIASQREEERAREAEVRDRHRSNFDNLRLAADSGGLTETEINAALARDEINASQADGLRGETRAAAGRAYTERRRAEAEASRAEADRRRAENEAQREANRAAAEARRDARDRARDQREAGQSLAQELQDRATSDPGFAVSEARENFRRGLISERQLRSVERLAQSEWARDYRDERANTVRAMGRNAPARDIDAMDDAFESWITRNPNVTPEQVNRWHTTFQTSYTRRRGAAASPGGGGARTRAQIDQDIARVRADRSMPAAQRTQRLNRLAEERRAAQR
jgi:hypothetical protein